jgi:hypothetical protein
MTDTTNPQADRRFWAKAIPANQIHDGVPCIEWTGAVDRDGYGRFGRSGLAHRWAFIWANGPDSIPTNTELDHLCRNRSCVAPAHLEAVSHRENLMRSGGVTAQCAAKTHCVNGHPFSVENTLLRPDGSRKCRTCKRECDRRRGARLRSPAAVAQPDGEA